MVIHVNIQNAPYDVVIERGVLNKAKEQLNLNRKVLIVTDKNVPVKYSECILSQCKEGHIVIIEGGEESKSLESFAYVSKALLDYGFSRKDCVVAVGGGVVGDLSGFVAASYMRGIDFYNIPTTVLSQVDSSVGGKTAVNFGGVKNIIGAFYQPKKVLIDVNVLETLSERLVSNGLAEAIKMAATFDKDLFDSFKNGFDKDNIEDLIARSIDLKRKVVDEDEKEQDLRKVLNFGHTIGHGIEVTSNGELLHGESVALGTLMLCSKTVKDELISVYKAVNLPTVYDVDTEPALEAISHDKKANGKAVSVVYVDSIGSFEFRNMELSELKECIIDYKKGCF